MRNVALGLLVIASLVGSPAEAAKRTACPAARYVVGGGPLLPGAPDDQVDVITVGDEAALSVGCDADSLRGAAKLRAGRKGTKVTARWRDCDDAAKVTLKGLITESCAKLSATLRIDGLRVTAVADRSACGDGFVDEDGGEECEAGGTACDDGACGDDCTCVAETTTSTSSTTSTTMAPACNPLAAPGSQGCAPGEKCTWILVAETPEEIGQTGCVPSGSAADGDACTRGPAGETTGYDDCAAGLVCAGGVCHDVCGFDGSPNAACTAGYQCTRYSGLFANGDEDPIAGGCVESCDPITQLSTSGDACPVGQGCYLLTSSSDTIAVCAGAGTLAHGATIVGAAFANTCLPGHQPRRRDQVMPTMECGALCRPTDVYDGVNEASEGGVTPDTCESKGAAAPSDPTNGESCLFYWMREPFVDLSPFSNTVGWCFRRAAFQYDSNGDMTPDALYPRCIDLTTGDVVPPIAPGQNDALYFGCIAEPASLPPPLMSLPRAPAPRVLLDRIDGWR